MRLPRVRRHQRVPERARTMSCLCSRSNLGPRFSEPVGLSRVLISFVVAFGCICSFRIATPFLAVAQGMFPGFAPQWAVRVGSTPEVIVVGTWSCAKPPCIELLRTTDGGRRFVRLASPPVVYVGGSATGSLTGLDFANSKDGYAFEGNGGLRATNLYATFDGGESWRREAVLPGYSVSGYAATGTRFYLVMSKCVETTTSMSCKNELATSQAGSNAWTATRLPEIAAFSDTVVGVAAYGSDVWLSEQTYQPLVVMSRNEGSTFSARKEPELAALEGCSLLAMSTKDLWAECLTGMLVSFFHSTDGGAHFKPIRLSRAFAATGGGAFAATTGSTAFVDLGSLSTADRYELFRLTAGGGASSAVGKIRLADITSLIFTSETTGFVVGYRQSVTRTLFFMLRTSDGGRTWATVSF